MLSTVAEFINNREKNVLVLMGTYTDPNERLCPVFFLVFNAKCVPVLPRLPCVRGPHKARVLFLYSVVCFLEATHSLFC